MESFFDYAIYFFLAGYVLLSVFVLTLYFYELAFGKNRSANPASAPTRHRFIALKSVFDIIFASGLFYFVFIGSVAAFNALMIFLLVATLEIVLDTRNRIHVGEFKTWHDLFR